MLCQLPPPHLRWLLGVCFWLAVAGWAVPVDENALPLSVTQGTTIGGVVRDEAERPIEYVKVRVPVLDAVSYGARNRYEWPLRGSKPVLTDAQGRWSFPGVPPDVSAVVVEFDHAEYCRFRAGSDPLPGQSAGLVSLDDLKAGKAVVTLKRRLHLTITALDAQTRQPIQVFTATPGFESGRNVRWQSRQTRRTTRAKLDFSTADEGSVLPAFLRIQASGHEPVVARAPRDATVDAAIEVVLPPGREITGNVVIPTREPAAGIQVALLTEFAGATLGRASFLRPAESILARTDPSGRFTFPPTPEAHTIVAVSPEGYAEFVLDGGGAPVELTLHGWSRLRGTLPASPNALPEPSAVFVTTDLQLPTVFPHAALGGLRLDPTQYAVETTQTGEFTLAEVPSGHRYFWYTVRLDETAPAEVGGICLNGIPVAVKPDSTHTIGLDTNSILARVVLPANTPVPWESVFGLLHLASTTDPDLPARVHYFTVRPGGTFRVLGIPAGNWQLTLRLFTPPRFLGQARRRLTFPVPGPSGVLALGEMSSEGVPGFKPGDPAPPLEVVTLEARKVRLSDLRGRHVLVHFWTEGCGARASSVPDLLELYGAYDAGGRFAILDVNLDADPEVARRALARNRARWVQGYGGSWLEATVPNAWPVSEFPSAFLVDPEGRIVASDLSSREVRGQCVKWLSPSE